MTVVLIQQPLGGGSSYNHDTLTTDTAFLSDYIATKASGNNQYAFTTSDKEQLTGIFQALAGKIGDLYSVTPTKIVDTIDTRFKLTEASRIALVGNVEGVKTPKQIPQLIQRLTTLL